ncbi:MAG: hypothetical protein ACI9OU_002032 [Candidatus Promineifilaceae bacterium]|jgi:hypothetical protein
MYLVAVVIQRYHTVKEATLCVPPEAQTARKSLLRLVFLDNLDCITRLQNFCAPDAASVHPHAGMICPDHTVLKRASFYQCQMRPQTIVLSPMNIQRPRK